MNNELFVASLGLALFLLLRWGFRVLPGERWQILCAVPKMKRSEGTWHGVNFTFYGLFNAGSVVLATALLFVLLGSLAVPTPGILAIVAVTLALSVPASKVLARLVEKKPSTLSIGGASFVGLIAAPWVTCLVNATLGMWIGFHAPVPATMAAICVAYAFGEGVGRLACISFGCCYGRPLSQVHPFLRKVFGKRHFVFRGETKKIAYASGLDSQEVIPVQAVTSILYCGAGLAGLYLFLDGHYYIALLTTLVTTQAWRFASEFLRADFRGKGKVSAYQIMGLAATAYVSCIVLLFPDSPPGTPDLLPDLILGLRVLWDPAMLVFLQILWVAIFLFTGKSQVTGCSMSFHVVRDKI